MDSPLSKENVKLDELANSPFITKSNLCLVICETSDKVSDDSKAKESSCFCLPNIGKKASLYICVHSFPQAMYIGKGLLSTKETAACKF